MSKVKRYDSYGYDGLSGLMKEHADGDWVRSEEFDALRAENAELVAALGMYFRAGAGNSTDFKKQADARKKADAALTKHRGDK